MLDSGDGTKEPDMKKCIEQKGLLDEIREIIRQNKPEKRQTHLLLTGSGGMGKTTLLQDISYIVQENEELRKEWLPILFSEKNYGIGDLADFWLEAIRHLEEILDSSQDNATGLLEGNLENLAQQAQDMFFHLLDKQGKRALFLLDNVNEIFSPFVDKQEIDQLRKVLTFESRLMLAATSTSGLNQYPLSELPFFRKFRILPLEPLQKREIEQELRGIAENKNNQRVIDVLEHEQERIQALGILTAGNPQLIKMSFKSLGESGHRCIKQDLYQLLDECNPFFKHRIERLNPTMRRVFDAIACKWDPATVGDLTLRLRKPSNYISTQIQRLTGEGFIEQAGGTDKKKTYQVVERFYNIYYLMRYSRSGRTRLNSLLDFMQIFYTRDTYNSRSMALRQACSDSV